MSAFNKHGSYIHKYRWYIDSILQHIYTYRKFMWAHSIWFIVAAWSLLSLSFFLFRWMCWFACIMNELSLLAFFFLSFFQIICLSANQNPYVVWLHTFLFVCAWANGFKHLWKYHLTFETLPFIHHFSALSIKFIFTQKVININKILMSTDKNCEERTKFMCMDMCWEPE